jgi:hypothetical protein
MTGNYQYTIGQQRIADLHREGQRERLATACRSQTTRTDRPSLLKQITRRLTPARVRTTGTIRTVRTRSRELVRQPVARPE